MAGVDNTVAIVPLWNIQMVVVGGSSSSNNIINGNITNIKTRLNNILPHSLVTPTIFNVGLLGETTMKDYIII